MKTFIPNIEESEDSDDSSDEIPTNGIISINQNGNGEGPSTSDDDHLSNDDDDDDNDENSDESELSELSPSCDDSEFDSEDSSEVEVTMEDIFGIKPSLEAQRDHPPDLSIDSGIVDICFHPKCEKLAAATMDGEVIVYQYKLESVDEICRYSHHKKACRAVCYSEDGGTLYSISKDKSFSGVDVETSDVKFHVKSAHDSPIYSFYPITSNTCATGDDEGTVKIWDLRTNISVFDFKCGEHTISSLAADENGKVLVAAINDGSLASFNVRAKKLIVQSEMYDSELTSLCIIRDGTKLIVGSGEGILYIFNWNEFAFHVDQYAGHPDQIHCLVPITDRLILTGCEDGYIRAVHLYGHRFVGVVGEHTDFGVENMSLSYDGNILASCAMDEIIRFWNIEYLYSTEQNKSIDVSTNLESSKRRNLGEFFKDFPDHVSSDEDVPTAEGNIVDTPECSEMTLDKSTEDK